jgi:hypothetical protein
MNENNIESRREEISTLWRQLSELLWSWNPIGLPVPSDEYDSLVTMLVRKLEKNIPAQEIAARAGIKGKVWDHSTLWRVDRSCCI